MHITQLLARDETQPSINVRRKRILHTVRSRKLQKYNSTNMLRCTRTSSLMKVRIMSGFQK